MKGDYSVTWKKWADEHFKRVRVLFRRIERTFGMSSYSSVQQMGTTLMENAAVGSRTMAQRFQRIAKKVSGQNRCSSNPMGNIKYGVRIPHNVKEALEFDRINGDHQWHDTIIREIEALMGQDMFAYLNDNAKSLKGKGFKFCPLHMIFDIKQDGC